MLTQQKLFLETIEMQKKTTSCQKDKESFGMKSESWTWNDW